MKFHSQDDARLFLVEVGDLKAALGDVEQDFSPTSEQLSSFVKGRRSLVPAVKDFRRQQNSREAWRKNRYGYMKGIKSFHRSVEGKRFHRALGRFLSTRDTAKSNYKRDTHENINDVCEALKALSSLRTHAYICCEYWRPVDDQVDYEIFLEELLPVLDRVERALLGETETTAEDLDMVVALTEGKALVAELADSFRAAAPAVERAFAEYPNDDNSLDETQTGFYLTRLNCVKNRLREDLHGRALDEAATRAGPPADGPAAEG